MRNLRIGVWLLENYVAAVGGGFGYYSELIDKISKTKFVNAEVCFLGNHKRSDNTLGIHKYHSISWRAKKKSFLSRIIYFFGVRVFNIASLNSCQRKSDLKHIEILQSQLLNICDIIYYPVPMCQFENFPFIYTLWDLGHLNSYAFPEVSHFGNFEERKNHNESIPLKALMVFCESEAGREDAVKFLNLNKQRIKIFPIFPSYVISEKLSPEKPEIIELDWVYLHYPAQFWAHKNHYNLMVAFSTISRKYTKIKLIFTGSDHGNMAYIDSVIKELNLTDRIINLGFVSFAELKWLYVHSRGLIMPTLLGPTNMPPLEAMALGCAVAISDMPGHREQLGNYAYYFNPLVLEEIEDAIEKLIISDSRGPKVSYPTAESNMALLDRYFGEIKPIRHTWL